MFRHCGLWPNYSLAPLRNEPPPCLLLGKTTSTCIRIGTRMAASVEAI